MSEHNRDKDQENYLLDQAQTIRDEIEVSVFGPSGIDTPPCAEAWATAKLIAELRARVEALEGSATKGSDHIGEVNKMVPDGSLIERVAYAITGDSDGPLNWKNEAHAAIHEVAAWLRSKTDLVYGPQCARWLEQQLDKPS